MASSRARNLEAVIADQIAEIEIIRCYDYPKYGIGYRGKQLVMFNHGNDQLIVRQISLAESLAWFKRCVEQEIAGVGFQMSEDGDAGRIRWYSDLAKAIGAAK